MNHDFAHPDYSDRFVLRSASDFSSIDDFVQRLTAAQPGWLTRLSLGIGDSAELAAVSEAALRGEADSIGNWRIIDRSERHVTFFEDLKTMAYRLTYSLDAPDSVTAETDVVQQTRWAGPIYWGIARWGHRRFLPMMMRNAGGSGSSTQTIL